MDDEGRCKCKICKHWFTPWEEGNQLEKEICINCYEEGIDHAEERRRNRYYEDDDYRDRFR